jgi:hypothetical protein
MRIALAVIALFAALLARADDDATAEELAAVATEQAFGSSAIEVWKSDWQDQQITWGVARRWQSGRVEVLLRVLEPHKYESLGFLFRPRESGAPAILYFRSPKLFERNPGKMLELPVASPIERLPFAPGLPALADLWPARAEDFQVARLPDTEVDGKPCRVLEQRPLRLDGAYDRIVTSLARDSNLALETRFLLGERLVRRVTISPADIDRTDARPVARRRTIDRPGEASQVLTLARFSLDPVFPDQLFTSSNLRTGRFPSY